MPVGAGGSATTIRGMLDRQADLCADRPALLFPQTGAMLTYRALQNRAGAIAVNLARRGLKQGNKVATVLENGAAAVEAFLGTQYGGFVATPLDPAAGPQALRELLAHADAQAVFASADTLARLDLAAHPTLRNLEAIPTDPDSGPLWREPEGLTELADVAPDDETVLDYTSGSSGTPKGVVVTHRNVLASAAIHACAQEMTATDRALLVLPLFHMNAQHVTLLSTLWSGGSVVVPRRFIPAEFWEWVRRYGCTWFAAVPTLLQELLQLSPGAAEAAGRRCLRFARSSAAALPGPVHRACEERFGIPIIQAMGMTESGGTFLFNPLPPGARKYGSVGRPVGYEARVADEHGHALGPDMPGEIQIRGQPVMKGYHREPAATAAMIAADGWLRTGDIGHFDNDGYYFISGRSKEIVKKGGTRIALNEVDAALREHPHVADAATIGVPDELFGENLVSYVVARDCPTPEAELREFCANRLGAFRSPSEIVFTAAIPRSATGKVQRHLLAKLDVARPGSAAAEDRPSAPEVTAATVEERLARIWEKVLNVSPVGLQDNFFDLGGFSLSALDMFIEIEKRFGPKLPVSLLFECPTVAQLAEKLKSGETKPWSSVVPIQPRGNRTPFFGVYAEDQVLFYRELALALGPDRPFYGVQSLTLKPKATIPKRLEDLASYYIRDLKRIRPQGPYLLGGQCTGAIVALEMACQLTALGDAVPMLAILDSPGPRWPPVPEGDVLAAFKYRLFRALLRYRMPADANVRERWFTHVKKQLLTSCSNWRRFRDMRSEFAELDLASLTPREREQNLRGLRGRWGSRYVPKRFSGRIALIRSEEYSRMPLKHLGADRWRNIARGGVDVYVVPGGHKSMFHEPYVGRLAEILELSIARCVGTSQVPGGAATSGPATPLAAPGATKVRDAKRKVQQLEP